MLVSDCECVDEARREVFEAVGSGDGWVDVGGFEGEEGLRRAVKSTADEERCIRAKGEFVSPRRRSLIVG